MFQIAFKILVSIRSKLLFSFLVMSLIVIGTSLYASRGIDKTGQIAIETYDGPLQASTHAESARYLFSRIETSLLNETLRARNGQEIDWTDIRPLLEEFNLDLDIVASRSVTQKAAPYIEETKNSVISWKKDIQARDRQFDGQLYFKYKDMFETIYSNLDIISELQANAGFLEREAAQAVIKSRTFNIKIFMLLALILALTLAIWLSKTILNPLKTAVDVAKKVSAGNYDVAIPQGRKDETGYLLESMSMMQKNIRNYIARERNEKDIAKDNLSAALKNSKDAILIANAQGKIILANEHVKALFPHVIGADFIGADLARYFNYAGHPVVGAAQTFAQNDEMHLENGAWTKINASDMEEGGRLFIWHDITDLKAREVTLRDAKDKAESADQAKTLFLASMSHELRTPLNAVIGFSDLMVQQTLGPLGNEEYLDLSRHILTSGESLLRMIEDVLVVAGTRNESRDTLDFEDMALIPLIDTAVAEIRTDCAKENIGLIWTKPKRDFTLNCNAHRLNRVLRAVMSNAVKFNKNGGFVKISLKATPETFAQTGVFIDVADTGIGISDDDLKLIMAPFVQADNSYSRAYEGAGLGLALALQWTQLHDGKISIASKLDQGTVVRIFLPAAQQAESLEPLNLKEVETDNVLKRTA